MKCALPDFPGPKEHTRHLLSVWQATLQPSLRNVRRKFLPEPQVQRRAASSNGPTDLLFGLIHQTSTVLFQRLALLCRRPFRPALQTTYGCIRPCNNLLPYHSTLSATATAPAPPRAATRRDAVPDWRRLLPVRFRSEPPCARSSLHGKGRCCIQTSSSTR